MRRNRGIPLLMGLPLIAGLVSSLAAAGDTITYSYDAGGRLIRTRITDPTTSGIPPDNVPITETVIRGSDIQASYASSYSVSWPAGTVAGDFAIIFVAGAYGFAQAPTGWTLVDHRNASYWNGGVITKQLTSADIAAGYVTITNENAYDSVLSILTLRGNARGIVAINAEQHSGGADTRTLTVPAAPPGSVYLYFGSARTGHSVTISEGNPVQSQDDGGAASGSLYLSTSPPASGSVDFNYGPNASGDYQVAIVVNGP